MNIGGLYTRSKDRENRDLPPACCLGKRVNHELDKMSSNLEYTRVVTEFGKVAWWDSARRSRATLLCVFFVALALLFVVLSPSGWVGLVKGLLIGVMLVYVSLHPDSRFYPGRLATSQPRGPEQHPRILYRIIFFATGSLVIWSSVREFLRHKG